MASIRQPQVVLVGRRMEHNENLGLGYLGAALSAAGIAHRTHYLSYGGDLPGIGRAILDARPAVVGMSFADGGSSFLPLGLGQWLRAHGYDGHITCGGQFATLAREWLLGRYSWIDSVVRFAGEVPLVALVQRVALGEGVDGVPGVTTRAGDGRPSDVLDPTPMRLVPERDELPETLGHASAHIAASRGCAGRCHYCGPAALQTLERAEGRRAGTATADLDSAGVGRIRRRDIDALADEMADLWHERDVRYFYFVDEHLLPYREPEALEYLREWRHALGKRRVGAFGMGAMLRIDRISEPMIRAFSDLGLVRCFVGLELGDEAEGRRFGRSAPGAREIDLIGAFARHGVATVSNYMLVHPYSTPDTIAGGIDLLERLPEGVFEANRMQVYHGTRLHERLLTEGRLIGNPLRYGYVYDDPAIERFAEIFSRLRAEAFWSYSVAYRTHDAHLALSLAHRIMPRRIPAELDKRLANTRRRVNALYVEAYRRALALALEGGGFVESGLLVGEMAERARALEPDLEAIEQQLLAMPPKRSRVYAPVRAAAAGIITFSLMGSPACDCGTSHTATRDGAVVDTGARRDARTPDARTPRDAAACTPADVAAARDEVVRIAGDASACFSGSVTLPTGVGTPVATFSATSFSPAGSYVTPCYDSATNPALIAAMEDAVESAIAADAPACIDGMSVPVPGGTQADMDRLSGAIACSHLGIPWGERIQIVLDASGAVRSVTSSSPMSEYAACIRDSLAGLIFPCLASFEVCPEFAIAE